MNDTVVKKWKFDDLFWPTETEMAKINEIGPIPNFDSVKIWYDYKTSIIAKMYTVIDALCQLFIIPCTYRRCKFYNIVV